MTSLDPAGESRGADDRTAAGEGLMLVHVLAGYTHRGGWTRAVCRCGHTGPARHDRARAAVALDRLHSLDPLTCAWCERLRAPEFPPLRPADAGLSVEPAGTGPWPDLEYLACADDLDTCARRAAALTARYAASAEEADASCRALLADQQLADQLVGDRPVDPSAAPALRMITGS